MYRENHAALPLPCTSAHGYSTPTQVKSEKKKKNAINFFLCFRSVDAIVLDKPERHHPSDVFSYVGVEETEGMGFPQVVPVTSSVTTSHDEGDEEKFRSSQRRNKGPCGFSRALKAALPKISLVNKIQKRKQGKNSASTTNESSITSSSNQEWPEGNVPRMISTSYASVEGKEDVVLPMASTFPVNEKTEEKSDGQYWRNRGRRNLSRVLKAVLFETSLATTIQKRKEGKKFGRNESSKYNQEVSKEDDPRMISDTSSLTNCSDFTTSSSNSSSRSLSQTSSTSSRSMSKSIKSLRSSSSRSFKSNLRYLSDKIRSNSNSLKANSRSFCDKNKLSESNPNDLKEGHGQDQHVINIEKNNKKGCYRSIVSLCFLLMSLLGLIFYGKICAILCTSMWLFSAPLWTGIDGSTNKVEKKKFIGSGLLARDTRTIHRQ